MEGDLINGRENEKKNNLVIGSFKIILLFLRVYVEMMNS